MNSIDIHTDKCNNSVITDHLTFVSSIRSLSLFCSSTAPQALDQTLRQYYAVLTVETILKNIHLSVHTSKVHLCYVIYIMRALLTIFSFVFFFFHFLHHQNNSNWFTELLGTKCGWYRIGPRVPIPNAELVLI